MPHIFQRFTITLATGLCLFAGSVHAENLVISNWDGYMALDAIGQFNSSTGNSAELIADLEA